MVQVKVYFPNSQCSAKDAGTTGIRFLLSPTPFPPTVLVQLWLGEILGIIVAPQDFGKNLKLRNDIPCRVSPLPVQVFLFLPDVQVSRFCSKIWGHCDTQALDNNSTMLGNTLVISLCLHLRVSLWSIKWWWPIFNPNLGSVDPALLPPVFFTDTESPGLLSSRPKRGAKVVSAMRLYPQWGTVLRQQHKLFSCSQPNDIHEQKPQHVRGLEILHTNSGRVTWDMRR